MDKVAIVIIVHKLQPDRFEQISLTQCYRILGRHPIYYVCPEGLSMMEYLSLIPSATIKYIDPKWQKDYRSFNRLKIDAILYKMFSEYEYILFYEPDAFVFRDELIDWCDRGYDYIGAPWFVESNSGIVTKEFYGVGNGGFSLRKVSGHLRVLGSYARVYSNKNLLEKYNNLNHSGKVAKFFPYIGYSLGIWNNTLNILNTFAENEDKFWGKHALEIFDWFRVPEPETALSFAFEQHPSFLYNQNKMQLPFGCHAWPRYEPEFWESHIKEFGHILNPDENN